jgi:hypothetical protein
MTLEELKQQVAQAQADAKAKVEESIEVARLTAQLNMYQSEPLQRVMAKLELEGNSVATLRTHIATAEQIVASMPVMNSKTRELRKFRTNRIYGYGDTVALITALVTGIQYSANEHKAMILAAVGLDEVLVSQLVEALGQMPYYSTAQAMVMSGVAMNVEATKFYLEIVASRLGIVVDTARINEVTYNQQYQIALAKADLQAKEVEITNSLTSKLITVGK